jgi:hypothetical protein
LQFDMNAYDRCTNLKKKFLPIVLPSMSIFSILMDTDNTLALDSCINQIT